MMWDYMKTYYLKILITCLLLFYGCNSSQLEYGNIDPLEGNILFTVFYDTTGIIQSYTGFIILMATEEIYGSSNFEIRSQNYYLQGSMRMKIKGIFKPSISTIALGRAKLRIALELLDGKHNLEISYRDQTDIYELEIEEQKVKVSEIETSFTIYEPLIIPR